MVELPIRVLLVDDHALVRNGLKKMLSDFGDVVVVGEASDGREALRQVSEHDPKVVVMDVGMPRLNGLEATRRLKRDRPDVSVVILTMYNTEETLHDVLEAGAKAFLYKDCEPEQLHSAIVEAARGEYFLPPSVSRTVVDGYLVNQAKATQTSLQRLTAREREVLQLLAEGRSNREVAKELTISLKTVETHRTNLMKKLNLHNVADLVRYAIRKGVTEVGGDALESMG